jgi:hypothetical protein
LRAGFRLFAVLIASASFSTAHVASAQTVFASPEKAVDGLISAVRAGSTDRLLRILGPGSKKLVSSGDTVADAQARKKLVGEYDATNTIEKEDDTRAVLVVGKDAWPFPFPIVKQGTGWRFDSRAGAEEIIDRRIGANELAAIEVCRAYVAAQREYAEEDRNHNGILEYARKFLSSPGKEDGLYWPTKAGADESPLGPLIVRARAAGYGQAKPKGRTPYHGYYYKILLEQGPAARDGAYGYVVEGHMIAGFALVAYPAQYGSSGIMTFIVNQDGIVYQKNLGADTAELANEMQVFNPDPTWTTP